jgi:YHS domain-containing protein
MTAQAVLYFLIWAAFFALMMRVGCGAHVMGHQHRHTGEARPGESDTDALSEAPAQAVDPVCSKLVRPSEAKSSVFGRQIYYFCSSQCRDKFEAAPLTYTKGQSTQSPQQEHHHGCC